jgi:predicted DNA-binding transcriptional regulator YafY
MQALCEAGVPVVGSPGQGYSLMEGYFLPPIGFTAEEAVTLLLGLDIVERQFDAAYQASSLAARSKIEAILPKGVLEESIRMRSAWKLVDGGSRAGDDNLLSDKLSLLRQAVLEERLVRFRYTKAKPETDGGELESVRDVEPYGLVSADGYWILVAYCRLRGDIRHFRISRIREPAVLEERFRRPAGFELQSYRPVDDRNVFVRLLFRPELEALLRESGYFYLHAIEPAPEGLRVTLRVRRADDALHWVLGWGSGVTVHEPEQLKTRVRQEIENMLRRY